MPYHTYLLRCSDGSLYVGHCADLAARLDEHQRGEGARWTAARLPVVLVHTEEFPSRGAAIAREQQLKGWSRAKKLALAARDPERLRGLTRRRNKPGSTPVRRPRGS